MRTLLYIACSLALLAASMPAKAQDLSDFEREIRTAASQAGVSQRTIDMSLRDFQPNEHVIDLDRRQPETTQTFDQYFAKVATDARIDRGQTLLDQNQSLLDRIQGDYGVTPSILVALWGMEVEFRVGPGRLRYHPLPCHAVLRGAAS